MRTLCYRCKDNYELAGYRCKWTGNKTKAACDLCGRPGMDYNVSAKRGGARHGQKVRQSGTPKNIPER